MTTYNRYIENNSEVIEVVDKLNSYKSYIMYIHDKKYNIICDDYYKLLYNYKCENMTSGEIFKRIIPKEYLKYYPDYYKYQDENFVNNPIDKNPDEEYDEEYDEDQNTKQCYTDISEHSNVRINTNYKFLTSTLKNKYIRQQQKLKQKDISDQIKYH